MAAAAAAAVEERPAAHGVAGLALPSLASPPSPSLSPACAALALSADAAALAGVVVLSSAELLIGLQSSSCASEAMSSRSTSSISLSQSPAELLASQDAGAMVACVLRPLAHKRPAAHALQGCCWWRVRLWVGSG
jgi:hypothetical protein